MQYFCEQGKDKEAEFQPVVCNMGNVIDGSTNKKVHTEVHFRQSEILENIEIVRQNSISDKFYALNDHGKISKSEEESMNTSKILQSGPQISHICGNIVAEEIDLDSTQYVSSKAKGKNQLVKDAAKQETIETQGTCSIERKPDIYSSQELKVLSDAMPQNPHYRSFSAFGEKFRSCMIMALERGFMAVADQIRGFADAENVKWNASIIKNELMYLEKMGFDVQRLRSRIDDLSQLAEAAEQKQTSFIADQRGLGWWKD